MRGTSAIHEFLREARVAYTVVPHRCAFAAKEEAAAVHVPGRDWAKGVDNRSTALGMPAEPHGLVVFARGSGSSRHSPRNQSVACSRAAVWRRPHRSADTAGARENHGCQPGPGRQEVESASCANAESNRTPQGAAARDRSCRTVCARLDRRPNQARLSRPPAYQRRS
jgi:hypothetical protein